MHVKPFSCGTWKKIRCVCRAKTKRGNNLNFTTSSVGSKPKLLRVLLNRGVSANNHSWSVTYFFVVLVVIYRNLVNSCCFPTETNSSFPGKWRYQSRDWSVRRTSPRLQCGQFSWAESSSERAHHLQLLGSHNCWTQHLYERYGQFSDLAAPISPKILIARFWVLVQIAGFYKILPSSTSQNQTYRSVFNLRSVSEVVLPISSFSPCLEYEF